MTEAESLLTIVRQALEGLKRTQEGTILHGLIARGLRKFEATPMAPAFVAFADRLLERYLASPDSDPATRVRIKLIQQRLKPYLEMAAEGLAAAAAATPPPAVPAAPLEPAVTPVVAETVAVEVAPAAEPVAPESPPTTVAPATLPAEAAKTPPAAVASPIEDGEPAAALTEPGEPEPAAAHEPAAAVPLEDVEPPTPAPAATPESLPAQLAREMTETLAGGGDLDGLLHKSLAALEAGGTGANLAELKRDLVQGIEELLHEHRQLENNLENARAEIQQLDASRRSLEQTLSKVREHSLTDELTGLPNRQAFLRGLNAEIGRARRYGFSLSLALIDIDNLDAINTRYGRAAGDAVLHTYAREIMSQFRGYDMVARYGGDEFAVLLPNTQKEGATRAVDKAQKQAAATYISVDGHNIPLPSFSSVLTVYAHGEPPAALLKRADEALSHAKQRGRAQAAYALPPAG